MWIRMVLVQSMMHLRLTLIRDMVTAMMEVIWEHLEVLEVHVS